MYFLQAPLARFDYVRFPKFLRSINPLPSATSSPPLPPGPPFPHPNPVRSGCPSIFGKTSTAKRSRASFDRGLPSSPRTNILRETDNRAAPHRADQSCREKAEQVEYEYWCDKRIDVFSLQSCLQSIHFVSILNLCIIYRHNLCRNKCYIYAQRNNHFCLAFSLYYTLLLSAGPI